MKHSRTSKQSGFTLVELAIVIVIIGLIVGGILVGQDLIKAATVRATLSDLEKYNSAATTFRTKYGGLPGDLLAAYATQFGFVTGAGRTGAAAIGDGNGLVEGCAANSTVIACETALFWNDMSIAGLIPQRLVTYQAAAVTPPAAIGTIALMQGYLPVQKIRQGAFQYAYSDAGKNYFTLATYTADAAGVMTSTAAVTPGEARSMDEKLDDALPTTGVVHAVTALIANVASGTGIDNNAAAAATATSCSNGTATPVTYNVAQANIDNINCRVRFRASF